MRINKSTSTLSSKQKGISLFLILLNTALYYLFLLHPSGDADLATSSWTVPAFIALMLFILSGSLADRRSRFSAIAAGIALLLLALVMFINFYIRALAAGFMH